MPAEKENENLHWLILHVQFANGKKFIGLFTDQWALNRYYRKQVLLSVVVPGLIRDIYDMIKDDDKVSGIIINPGREEYIMTKEMLNQLFTKV